MPTSARAKPCGAIKTLKKRVVVVGHHFAFSAALNARCTSEARPCDVASAITSLVVRVMNHMPMSRYCPISNLLSRCAGNRLSASTDWHSVLVTRFGASADEIQVSLNSLQTLRLIEFAPTPHLIAQGKLFVAAVED